MPHLISFVHISLDGFVAGPKGEMDWITVNEEIFDHVAKRVSETDTALYGRVTFQMMEGYWPNAGKEPDASKHDIEHSRWYNNAHKVVLSKTLQSADFKDTTVISNNIPERIKEIKQKSSKEILIFGSPSATHTLMQHNLVDGYWLFVNPVILGKGIRLFEGVKEKTKLDLQSTHQFDCGVTELSYLVKNR